MKRVLSIIGGTALLMALAACGSATPPNQYSSGGPIISYKSNLSPTQTEGPAYSSGGPIRSYTSNLSATQTTPPAYNSGGPVKDYTSLRAQ